MKRNPIVLRKLPLFNTMSLITDTCHRFQFKKTCFEVRPFLLSKQLWLPDVKTRRWIHRFASFYSLTFINNLYSSSGNSSSLESILSALPRASIFHCGKQHLKFLAVQEIPNGLPSNCPIDKETIITESLFTSPRQPVWSELMIRLLKLFLIYFLLQRNY